MLSISMEKVIIVGAGLTGAVSASLLRHKGGENVNIEIWDKSRGTGGRMSTSRDPASTGSTVDLGAQYVSTTPDYFSKHEQFYDDLLKDGTIKPLAAKIDNMRDQVAGTQHFVPPDGMGSIVKHFLKKANATSHFGERISRVDIQDKKWRISTENGVTSSADCVVLTVPVPQLLQLQGDVHDVIGNQSDVLQKLSAVQYSSRFALGLFYDPDTTIDVPWASKYFKGDDCVVFVSIDNKKRGKDASPSVVVHTTVPFGLKHLEEDSQTICDQYILPKLQQLVPELPKHVRAKPHKWRYSQVYKAFEGSPGAIVLHSDPLLICAGDGFTHSNVDGCISSAQTVLQLLSKHAKL